MTKRNTNRITAAIALLCDLFLQYYHHIITLAEAVARSGLSKRTFQRRYKAWREGGPDALVHGNTGRPSANRLSPELRAKILDLIINKYYDFGPTLLSDNLLRNENIKISKETARRLINEASGTDSKQRRIAEHPLRRRRGSFGELIQIDGSPHRWFGEDGPMVCLIAFVDDATGRLTAARFFPAESFEGYVTVLQEHLHRHGLPIALYSDRHSTFTSNRDKLGDRQPRTQFSRVCKMLGIELILAQSPHAKGRVERMFKTLQGRWPQEFRVAGVCDIEQANMRISEFIEIHNAKYAIAPTDEADSHVLLNDEDWPAVERICAVWSERTVSKSMTVSLEGQVLQIVDIGDRRMSLVTRQIHVIRYPDGRIELLWRTPEGDEVLLNYKAHPRTNLKKPKILTATAKTIDAEMMELAKQALNAPNSWKVRHHKEGVKGVERVKKREQKLKDAQALKEKLQALHGKETAAKILSNK